MPLYEFECLQCGMCFEALVPMGKEEEVRCEDCSSFDIRKCVSSFGIGGSGRRSPKGSSSCASCSSDSCATCR